MGIYEELVNIGCECSDDGQSELTCFPCTVERELRNRDDDIKRLRDIIFRTQVASEFHSQAGVSGDVARYAHESTKRLCDEALFECADSPCAKCGGLVVHASHCKDCGFKVH